jgi:putative ABC transport system permease protein
MDLSELISEALSTLTVNKMRTGLATLGIIIGIGSVIALISLGQSSQKSIENQIQSLGSNLLSVIPGSSQSAGGVRGGFGSSTTLTYNDAKALANNTSITSIQNISPEYDRRTQVTAGRNNTNTQIIGAVPAYAPVHNLTIATGSFISQRDVDAAANVAVLGPQVVTDLFGDGSDPTGSNIRINKQAFKIIGVAATKGGSGFNNPDDYIYIPLTTAQQIVFGVNYLSSISVQAKSAAVMTQAQNDIGYFLLARHKITDPTQADFSILSQSDILGTINQVTSTFTSLLAGIAAISLLVGGIGIMNIMLVTVTERTREIGLRKALGAKKRAIISQFLLEAIILTGAGGILGMVFGMGISYIISALIKVPFVISFSSVVLAIAVSGAIGIIFGWYPARKAANLQPIEALRYE